MGILFGLLFLAIFLLMLALLPSVDGIIFVIVILLMVISGWMVLISIREIFDLVPNAEEKSAKAYRTTEALNKNKLKIKELAESKISYNDFYYGLCELDLPISTIFSLCFKYRPVSSFFYLVVPSLIISIMLISLVNV